LKRDAPGVEPGVVLRSDKKKVRSVLSQRVWVYGISRVLDDVWTTVRGIGLNSHRRVRDKTARV
jgi:hypothetical protein